MCSVWVIVGLAIWFGPSVQAQNDQEAMFRERSLALVRHTASHYKPPSLQIEDPEKYIWPLCIARFETFGPADSLANRYVDLLAARSPFHFTLVGMARMLHQYPEVPSLQVHRRLILEQVFARTDSQNPWTSEGTENHISMARTSGYLFAQAMAQYPEQHAMAKTQMEAMKRWIMEWSKRLYHLGNGEWNSSTYAAYNLIGWLNLFDFADDAEVKLAARAVLDYYAAETALFHSWGVTGGAEMRGNGITSRELSATAYLAWLWFSPDTVAPLHGFQGSQYIQVLHAATSGYRPPEALQELAQKTRPVGATWLAARPSYLYEQPSFVQLRFHIGQGYTLGSASDRYGGFTGASVQITNWKLVVAPSAWGEAPQVVSGNGAYEKGRTGKSRTPFTQIAQQGPVLFQLTHVPAKANRLVAQWRQMTNQWATDWLRDYALRWPTTEPSAIHQVVNFTGGETAPDLQNASYLVFPAETTLHAVNDRVWARVGSTYLFLQAVSQRPVVLQTRENGAQILTDSEIPGKTCGWVLETFAEADFGKWEEFLEYKPQSFQRKGTSVHYTTRAGTQLRCDFMVKGVFMEPLVDWGYGATTPMTLATSPPFRQPRWPEGKGSGRMARCRVNGVLQPAAGTTLFNGPGLILSEGILQMDGYQVNYQERVPRFLP